MKTILASVLVMGTAGIGTASPDVVTEWNAIMTATVNAQNPLAQARLAAITQLAVFEAVNAATRDYEPYLGSVWAVQSASPEAAAITAAHDVLRNYFPANAVTLAEQRTRMLAMIPDGPAKTNGMIVGQAAAAAMIEARANDGSAAAMTYTPLSGPGYWQPTPPGFAPGTFLHWGRVTPFGIVRADQYRSAPPPTLTSATYRRDYDEVKRVGGTGSTERPQDRADISRYTAAASPVQLWNSVAQQVLAAEGRPLPENARVLALLNMAMCDASIVVFETKYFYHFWRPVTAIRAGDTDGNPATAPDPAFTPFIATPAYPSYPSGYGGLSNAASYILERAFGNGRREITVSSPSLPGVTFRYTKFRQITDDIADARVYGGIHFRFEQEESEALGRRVARDIWNRKLRCVNLGRCEADDDR